MRILYGEGDRYSCWVDVQADAIAWHELSSGLPLKPVQASPGSALVRGNGIPILAQSREQKRSPRHSQATMSQA